MGVRKWWLAVAAAVVLLLVAVAVAVGRWLVSLPTSDQNSWIGVITALATAVAAVAAIGSVVAAYASRQSAMVSSEIARQASDAMANAARAMATMYQPSCYIIAVPGVEQDVVMISTVLRIGHPGTVPIDRVTFRYHVDNRVEYREVGLVVLAPGVPLVGVIWAVQPGVEHGSTNVTGWRAQIRVANTASTWEASGSQLSSGKTDLDLRLLDA